MLIFQKASGKKLVTSYYHHRITITDIWHIFSILYCKPWAGHLKFKT